MGSWPPQPLDGEEAGAAGQMRRLAAAVTGSGSLRRPSAERLRGEPNTSLRLRLMAGSRLASLSSGADFCLISASVSL
ncbi:hypothetical protein PGT21_021132 [Puccinia graminis f. sp. tritici]|uniref:Uncharacterized protein n=1 Tax=Puccinia graminis f. sp. tritici TaxID=56615 RepID=A0A5B0MQA8_PUCGR|nr:hypothetical protein PGTUg99_012559 [Puccinia graminis f. sp. tritici]KAA1084209.1 hypothetical protein PGT21_021132 [Puccinia graminis f. sp. tritici]